MKFLVATVYVAISLNLAFAYHALAGHQTGNGGSIWLCTIGRDIQFAKLLDTFEVENEFGLSLIKPTSQGWEAELNLAFDRLKLANPEFYKHAMLEWALIKNRISLTHGSDARLVKINDATIRVYPTCPGFLSRFQLANYTPNMNLVIDSQMFGQLSIIDQAALFVHEIVYATLRTLENAENSDRARLLTGFLFSTLEPKEYGVFFDKNIKRNLFDLYVPQIAGLKITGALYSLTAVASLDATGVAQLLKQANMPAEGRTAIQSTEVPQCEERVTEQQFELTAQVSTSKAPESLMDAFQNKTLRFVKQSEFTREIAKAIREIKPGFCVDEEKTVTREYTLAQGCLLGTEDIADCIGLFLMKPWLQKGKDLYAAAPVLIQKQLIQRSILSPRFLQVSGTRKLISLKIREFGELLWNQRTRTLGGRFIPLMAVATPNHITLEATYEEIPDGQKPVTTVTIQPFETQFDKEERR